MARKQNTQQQREPMTLPTGHVLEYQIGDWAYVKTDKEQNKRLVTAIELTPNNGVMYGLAFMDEANYFYGIQLDHEEDTVFKVT